MSVFPVFTSSECRYKHALSVNKVPAVFDDAIVYATWLPKDFTTQGGLIMEYYLNGLLTDFLQPIGTRIVAFISVIAHAVAVTSNTFLLYHTGPPLMKTGTITLSDGHKVSALPSTATVDS